jgi:methyl-accepting chemotaxis protein
LLYKLPPFNYKYSMSAGASLAQISGEQAGTSERLSIGVRLGATAAILAISLAAGRREAAIVAAVTMACLGGLSLAVHVLHIRKRATSLFLPAILLDALAVLLMGGAALAADRIEEALSTLFVLEAYCLSVTLLAALRMSVRDCVVSAAVAVLTPALVSSYAVLRFPGSIAAALLIIPALNALVGAFAALACHRYTTALRDNFVTEDLLRASRRLKMTMDIVTASIFNLHQLINKLGEVSTTVSEGARNQAAGIEQVTAAAEQLQGAMESISHSTEKSATTIGTTAQFSESGNTIVKKVIEEILGIHDVVDKMVAALARINDIADQTNLLALNAAIEASHTGDQQSGFSVVADEIRTLAEKSAEIASEVSKWVKQIETVIERGGESSREAGKIFDTIAHDLGSYAGFIHELSHSVKEQLGANREVTGAIESIGSVVEDNRFSAEAVTRIIEDLKREMTKLESLVGDQTQETAKLSHSAKGGS